MPKTHVKAVVWLATAAVIALSACQEPPPQETELFQLAEAHLRRGDYDEASRYLEQFLAAHPESPLAPIAERRLINIDRELEAVMGRRSSPAPIYLRPEPPPAPGDDQRASEWGSSER